MKSNETIKLIYRFIIILLSVIIFVFKVVFWKGSITSLQCKVVINSKFIKREPCIDKN